MGGGIKGIGSVGGGARGGEGDRLGGVRPGRIEDDVLIVFFSQVRVFLGVRSGIDTGGRGGACLDPGCFHRWVKSRDPDLGLRCLHPRSSDRTLNRYAFFKGVKYICGE